MRIAFLLAYLCGLVAVPTLSADEPVADAEAANAVVPWSVVGTWNTVHQHWAKPITISADGRFFVDHGDHKDFGNWKLAAEGDHLNLVLGWDGWEPETVALVGPDEFRGKVPTGQMILRRGIPASGQASAGPGLVPAAALSPEGSPCGAWAWQHNATTNTINPDGTVEHGGDKGTWRWLDQPNRKLQIDWKSGFVDTATLSADGKTMRVANNADDEFTMRRIMVMAEKD